MCEVLVVSPVRECGSILCRVQHRKLHSPNRNMKGAEFTGKLVNTSKLKQTFCIIISNDAKVNSILKVLSSLFLVVLQL